MTQSNKDHRCECSSTSLKHQVKKQKPHIACLFYAIRVSKISGNKVLMIFYEVIIGSLAQEAFLSLRKWQTMFKSRSKAI